MNVLIYLIPVALFLGGLGLVAFLWSLKNGQYEDMEGAANRILIDEKDPDDPPAKT
ncbi:cbb3-type cytochrome oxidase assembly protein CcoS [Sneathiella marina]|uniref:Cbb3-type cytochrome oxidase assembly protein CcoS n=1 Tax=Sneathiella marina TaxID=2950108 RepID=A0ABY4VZQ1_9PROT|nr:cbb3-type cytochrome oxidase assembly protein CcoS [Sneathiella marina]USG60417.1 cbb3-type cytochrome oxidase assembly protein CcoS [Sneathiella marina]